MGDYRDLVIDELAMSERFLLERVSRLHADVESYRELAQQAIHALATATKERDCARHRLRLLLNDQRRGNGRAAA